MNSTKTLSRQFRRLSITAVAVLAAVSAIGAATALSRKNPVTKGQIESPNRAARDSNGVSVKVVTPTILTQGGNAHLQELSSEEKQKLAKGLGELINNSDDGLVQVQHANGSVLLDLKDRFHNVTVARVNADGSVTHSCVNDRHAAGAFFGIDPELIVDNQVKPEAK